MQSTHNLKERNAHCYGGSEYCATPRVYDMANHQNESYKSLHEAFVSNNSGTSPLELLIVVAPYQFATLCFQLLCTFDFLCNKSTIFMFSLEFITVVMLQIYVVTLGADHCFQYFVALIMLTTFLVALKLILGTMDGSNPWPSNILDSRVVAPDNPIFTALTNLRTHLCLIVCIAILAVDFPIFPRRFAKTETYGYGLMDTGIGFFMIINGLFAPEARIKYQFSSGNTSALMKSLISSIPLLLIGFLRIVFVKSLNYQEHVTEYGVHWNFFFSLAFAKIGCSLVFLFFRPVYSGAIAAAMSVCYEGFLHLGLDDIIFNGIDGKDTRSNIFDANREGLASCMSFTCMYLIGTQVGYLVFRTGVTLRDWLRTIFILFAASAMSALVACLSHFYNAPSSRRLVNVTYISWVTAYLVIIIVAWLVIDVVVVLLKFHSSQEDAKYHVAQPSIINKIISYNFLLAFLVANLLTGLVNMTVSTIFATDSDSFMILTLYILAICLIMVICHWRKWKLKMG